ncbi:MAG TPA: hypothetical protein VOA87_20810 [Thermoanaerobaculia bacterium]|nr:hypothetical protein [Thermoanaerobaculia bacterium]
MLSVILLGALFAAQGRIGFDPADEGFQWYGSVRTAHGGVPLRDFYSYDPGRYLWAAAWASGLGDGILALRLSTAIFAVGGLFLGLLAARRALTGWVGLALAAVVLGLWMFPRHKLFEPAISMAAVFVALRLLEKPSQRRHFAAGMTVGLAIFLGKNHGLYLFLVFLVLILFLHFRIERGPLGKWLLAWGTGIAAGLAPLGIMMVLVPGFFRSYIGSILFFLAQGKTNNPLPVPWPWRVAYADLSLLEDLHGLALGLGFLLLPLFCILAVGFAAGTTRANLGSRAPLLAAGCVALFYMHHAFSRADAPHLGQSIHPVLLGLLVLPYAVGNEPRRAAIVLKAGIAVLVAFLTVFAALPESPLVRKLARERGGERYLPSEVAGDRLLLPPEVAQLLSGVTRTVSTRLSPAEPLLILPYTPGLYPVLGRESPVWDTYLTWPAKGGSDEKMVAQIREKQVRWALIGDYNMDGRGDFGFRVTHPALAEYLNRQFASVQAPDLPQHFVLMKSK